jgi:hypothetical protein
LIFRLGISGGERPDSRRGGNKNDKKIARIAFSQSSCGRYERAKRARPSQVVRNLLHLIRRVCVHRKNSTPQFCDVVRSLIVAPIVAQRVVTTGSNAGGLFG